MRKRLMCLALCLAMLLLPVLTGCNNKNKSVEETVSDAASESAVTLTMWMVSEDPVDAETVSAINQAVNAITKTKYKTRLIVKFYTEAEYRDILDDTIISYLQTRSSGQTYVDHSIIEDDSEDGEKYGINIIKYPDPVLNQVDIVYISGKDMYVDYIENGWLSALDAELSSSSKKIKEYVNASLLSAAKYIDNDLGINGTYAIPNNHSIGEYTMMLLDKTLMEQTSFDSLYKLGQIDGLFNDDVYSYLETVRDGIQNGTLNGVLPIAADYETCLDLLAYYWNINPDTLENEDGFSFLGYTYEDFLNINRGTELKFESLFENEAFVNAFLKLNEYRLDGGYFGAENETTKAAMKIVTGNYSDLKAYRADDSAYYPVVLKNPTVLSDDVYENMFGVCAYTRNLSRSMQIVTHLNTNAEFRNILQYGVEGFNYKLEYVGQTNDQIVVPIADHPYNMSVYKSGNAFLTYPTANMDRELWEDGKLQNRDVNGADPLLDVAFVDIANQGNSTESTSSIGSSGYVWDYQTGYSKEILSRQKQVKAWLDDCDAKGEKGIYAFSTWQESGQNVTYRIFIYNNDTATGGTAAADEKVGLYVHQASDGTFEYYFHGSHNAATAAAGSSEIREKGDYLEVVYEEGTASGYELSILEINGRKNTNVGIAFSVKGESVNAIESKKQNSLVSVDLNEAPTYKVYLSTDIAKTTVSTNSVIWNWIKNDCAKAEAGVPQVLKSSKTVGTGADAYQLFTFVVYTTGLKNQTAVSMYPKGTGTDVILDVDFDQSGKALKEDDANYAIWMITLLADPTVATVTMNLVYNGSNTNVVETVAETDPDFIYRGTLDTQLVRYIYDLNAQIVTLLNGIDNYADFKTAVKELQILLDPDEVAKTSDFTVLSPLVTDMDFSTHQYRMKYATSVKHIEHEGYTGEFDEHDEPIYGVIKIDPITNESYILLDSPYAVYRTWMVAKKYISK